jgi:peptidoglycan/LPS O-acetylase OafA/YrhL
VNEPPASITHHLRSLTGLRIVAAVAVYASHLPPPKGDPGWLYCLQESGYAGVTMFFVLSGFVLTINYFDRLRTGRQAWSYAAARIARVYPLYLVVLGYPAVHMWVAGALPRKRLLEHAAALQAWDPNLSVAYGFVAPAWSISVEVFLYATLPILLPLVRLADRRLRHLLTCFAVTTILLFGLTWWFQLAGRGALPWTNPASAHRWLYRMPLTRVGDFALGILAARIYVRVRGRAGIERLGLILATAAIAATVAMATQRPLLFSVWSWDAIYALPAAALIFGLAVGPNTVIARLLSLSGVVFLGEASYAFYLSHKITLALVDGGASWSHGLTAAAVAVELYNLAFAVAVAIGLHVGVERPARVYVRRWLDRGHRTPGGDGSPRADAHSARHRPASQLV